MRRAMRKDSSAITTVYFIRHGSYENPKKILHGRLPGFPLSAKGKKEAKDIATRLSSYPVAAVFTSPLARAKQTAEVIAKTHNLRPIIDRRLIDIKTPLQGMPTSYIDAIGGNFYTPDLISKGGETMEEFFARVDDFMRDAIRIHKGKHIVVVGHGDGIMTAKVMYRGKKLTLAAISRRYVRTAGGVRIVFKGAHPISVTPVP